jgi:hypothetical protein
MKYLIDGRKAQVERPANRDRSPREVNSTKKGSSG